MFIISAGHTLPAEFGPEPTEGSYKSHASPLPHPGGLATWSHKKSIFKMKASFDMKLGFKFL
jgi:hypothetical protein